MLKGPIKTEASADTPVDFQGDTTIWTTNLTASKPPEILHVLPDIELINSSDNIHSIFKDKEKSRQRCIIMTIWYILERKIMV